MTYESNYNMILILHMSSWWTPCPRADGVPQVDEFYRNQFETKTSCGVAALGSWRKDKDE